jgi:hypothetical protein
MANFQIDRPVHPAEEQPAIPAGEYAQRRAGAAQAARELSVRGLIIWSRAVPPTTISGMCCT